MAKKKERPVRGCALCHEIRELEESHIIPKFVFRYLRKTSHGAVRNLDNPNKVVQDSEKHYLLCGDCEDLFSVYETKFANKIFYPYQKDGVRKFSYDKDLFYFLTSVSWRSLYLDIIDFVTNYNTIDIDSEIIGYLTEKERDMREYLLGKSNHINSIENHIFFFDDIKEFYTDGSILKPHVTFHRTESSYTIVDKSYKTYATITNMMGIIIFTIYRKNDVEVWENTEIINGDGIIEAKDQFINSVCSNELIDIMKRVENSSNDVSEKQQNKINSKILKDIEGFKKSKIFDDLVKDRNL